MSYIDHLADADFKFLISFLANRANTKFADSGIFFEDTSHVKDLVPQIVLNLMSCISHLLPETEERLLNSTSVRVGPKINLMLRNIRKNSIPDSTLPIPVVRIGIRKQSPCLLQDSGEFPIDTPANAVLSMLYAKIQNLENLYKGVEKTKALETLLGRRTYKQVTTHLDNLDEIKLLEEFNAKEKAMNISQDGFPLVQSYLAPIFSYLMKKNIDRKGEYDTFIKEVVPNFKSSGQITTSDRDLQKKLYDFFESHADLLDGKEVMKLVFNTDLALEEPPLFFFNDFLIDSGKLTNLAYKNAVSSLSPQVANYIFEDKKKAKINLLKELINSLVTSNLTPGERKEINDRLLNPLKLFLKPDDDKLAKIHYI